MKPSWTISRLLKEHPTCRKVLLGYDIDIAESRRTSIRDLAEEIEEDLDDFLDELDHAAQAFNEYDVAVVGEGDDFGDDDDELVDEDEDDVAAEEPPLDDESPLGDADEALGYEEEDDEDDSDDIV